MAKIYHHIQGKDTYDQYAELTIYTKHGNVNILSSEEGDPVVFSKKQTKELIEILKKCLKED